MYKKLFFLLWILIFLTIPIARTKEDLWHRDGWLALYNTHTGKFLKINYLNIDGSVDPLALDVISYHLRCPYTQECAVLDHRLLSLLDQIQDYFGKEKTISVISAYRSPMYNKKLRANSEKVAKYSYHLKAKAIDFRIEGINLEDINAYANVLHQGGVGYYPKKFVHIDVGPVRFW
ncbi:MAG: DUF882 domain-containing protein [Candidatus Margulisbacteria bacterium]|nr:DUF882 domain-containing protein [Candidatus Margulisiibacteriota bacterium]